MLGYRASCRAPRLNDLYLEAELFENMECVSWTRYDDTLFLQSPSPSAVVKHAWHSRRKHGDRRGVKLHFLNVTPRPLPRGYISFSHPNRDMLLCFSRSNIQCRLLLVPRSLIRFLNTRMGSQSAEQRLNIDSVCVIGAGPTGLAAAK